MWGPFNADRFAVCEKKTCFFVPGELYCIAYNLIVLYKEEKDYE